MQRQIGFAEAESAGKKRVTKRLDSVKQDVRRIDSSELQLALTCCLT
jgi:hypothetical protein